MYSQSMRAITTRHSREADSKFLIQLTLDDQDCEDAWEFCGAIERLGAVETTRGFAFPTDSHREMALEMLGEWYGMQYFEKVDGLGNCPGASGVHH